MILPMTFEKKILSERNFYAYFNCCICKLNRYDAILKQVASRLATHTTPVVVSDVLQPSRGSRGCMTASAWKPMHGSQSLAASAWQPVHDSQCTEDNAWRHGGKLAVK
jgi:hypothetical protein